MDNVTADAPLGPTTIITDSGFCRFALNKSEASLLTTSPLLTPKTVRGTSVQDHFFDTDHFTLAQQGIALRVRKVRRSISLAVLHGGCIKEVALPTIAPDLSVFDPAWRMRLEETLQGLPLKIIATAHTTQTKRKLNETVVTLESGFLNVGAQKLAFSELEVMAEAPLLPEAALTLASHFRLRQQPETLAMRAVRLAGGPVPSPCKAGPGLRGTPSLDEAIAQIIQSCLTQFRTNWPVFYEGDKVGAIHQMRVSMRRLRSALKLFHRILPVSTFLDLRHDAKLIATVMGDARNWDVFIDALQAGPMAAFAPEVGFTALEAQCEAHRQAGYQQVDALLKCPDTTRFLLNAEAFLARRGWRANLPAEALPQLAEPARIMAAQALERLHRKLRKRGKNLIDLPVVERHLVRIELKKLRYAADFFGGLFKPEGRVQQFSKAASHLQEELGKLNDLATAEDLIPHLKAESVEAQRALGIILGWTAHAALGEPVTLKAAWKEFLNTRLFT